MLKEIPTEIKLRSPVLLDVPEFFLIRDKSDLDENFPASIRLEYGTLLAVKSVSSLMNNSKDRVLGSKNYETIICYRNFDDHFIWPSKINRYKYFRKLYITSQSFKNFASE